MRPSDFTTREEALEYTNIRLDEWKEKFREMENDMVSLASNPPSGEVEKISTKWKGRAAEIQEAKT